MCPQPVSPSHPLPKDTDTSEQQHLHPWRLELSRCTAADLRLPSFIQYKQADTADDAGSAFGGLEHWLDFCNSAPFRSSQL